MASRDLDIKSYNQLTLFDLNPDQIYEEALDSYMTIFPEFVAREGTTEVALLQALALEISELIFAVNRVPPSVVEILLKLFKLTKDLGAYPTTTVTFTMVNDHGYTIPLGTTLKLELDGGLEPIYFKTDTTLAIPNGETTGTVSATGQRRTDQGNDVLSGTPLLLVDALSYVSSVELGSDVANGRRKETDAKFLDRGITRLARLSDVLVLPRHFEAYALENPNVVRAFALDAYNPVNDPDNNGPIGVDPGYVTVAVWGDGAPLGSDIKTQLHDEMSDLAAAELNIAIIDPTITEVDVNVTVVKLPIYTTAQVTNNIVKAVQDFLSPETWDWGKIVHRMQLIKVIGDAEGVDYVSLLGGPNADVTLNGVAPLAAAGDISVSFA